MKLIVAVNNNGTIGQHGKIAWKCKADMRHFASMTKEGQGAVNHLIVGKKTAEGLQGVNFGPQRQLRVVGGESKSLGQIVAEAMYSEIQYGCIAWVIGGAEIYNLLVHLCDGIHISRINDDTEGDTKWEIPANYRGRVFTYNFETDDKVETMGGGETQ